MHVNDNIINSIITLIKDEVYKSYPNYKKFNEWQSVSVAERPALATDLLIEKLKPAAMKVIRSYIRANQSTFKDLVLDGESNLEEAIFRNITYQSCNTFRYQTKKHYEDIQKNKAFTKFIGNLRDELRIRLPFIKNEADYNIYFDYLVQQGKDIFQ